MRRWNPVAHWMVVLVLGATLVFPSTAKSQSQTSDHESRAPWALIDALGYACAGLGLGVLVASSIEPSPGFGPDSGQVLSVVLGTLGGSVVGLKIGSEASRKSDEGRLGSGHHTAAVAGTVLLGAGLGALAAVQQIEGPETDTPFGSDEATATLFTLVGAGVGALGAWWLWGDLDSSGFAMAPAVFEGGEVGLVVSGGF